MKAMIKAMLTRVWHGWFGVVGVLPMTQRAPSFALLAAAPGQGNIGDQAMLESFLSNTPDRVVVVARSAADITIPKEFVSRVKVVALPSLLYSFGPSVLADSLRFRALLRSANQFAVVGADIMDGAHNTRASVRRFEVANLAARVGVPTRILGFSWNERPVASALRALQQLRPDVVLIARDSLSAERLRASGAVNVVESADLAFAHPLKHADSEILEWAAGEIDDGRRVVLVNLNSLVEKRVTQVKPMASLVADLIARDYSVVAVPHDPRNLPSDVDLNDALARAVGSPRLAVAPIGLTPDQIGSLARTADATISARMHLTLISLNVGTPAIGISYQGKVSGLFEMLGYPEYCVEPEDGYGAVLTSAVQSLLENQSDVAETMSAATKALQLKARANFDIRGPEPVVPTAGR